MNISEKVDLRAINFLSSFTFKEFKSYVKWSCSDDEKKKLYETFKFFCKSHIKSKGEIVRIYSHTLTTPNDVGGRLFCGGSVQGLPADIRGAIMKHTTDIDMKNAHPTILLYLCKLHKIPCPNLFYFCENRDEIFNSISNDKDYCKKLFLKSINSDKLERKEKNTFFKVFDKECKFIQTELCKIEEYKDIVKSVPSHKLHNFNGSAINRILCSYENKILKEIINVLTRRGIEIGVLMFDGLMVYGNYYENKELLNEIEEHINNEFNGLNIKLSYKEHSNEIEIPDDYTIPTQAEQKEKINVKSFEDMCNEFEKNHIKILNTASFIKVYDNKIIFMNRTQLKTAYEHIQYEKIETNEDDGTYYITKHSFINEWLFHPNMRCYENVGIYPPPLECPNDIYNLWRPFSMELVEEYEEKLDVLEIFKKHILILCNNDNVVYEYLIKWIGQMIKYPAIKSICPVLISEEGAGKGTLMRLLEKMLGEEKVYETTKPSRDVWGDFNGRMVNSFLVNLNELSKKETLDATNYIKGLITDPKLTINNKGVGQYEIQSYHRWLITTNNEDPIGSGKDDRRKVIIRSSDELIGNKEYFTIMNDVYLKDINVIKTCYEFFKNLDGLDKFLSLPMPITEYQGDIQELSVSPIENWLKDLTINTAGTEDANKIMEYNSKEIYEEFKIWIKQNAIQYELDSLKFLVRLKRLKINGVEKKHTKYGNKTIINLQELREHFFPN